MNRNTLQHNWKYINQVAGCQNRHEPNKLATLWKKQTHITQKVKIYSEMQEIQNHICNSSTNTLSRKSWRRRRWRWCSHDVRNEPVWSNQGCILAHQRPIYQLPQRLVTAPFLPVVVLLLSVWHDETRPGNATRRLLCVNRINSLDGVSGARLNQWRCQDLLQGGAKLEIWS